MERINNLSKNLRAFQANSESTLSEFSNELGIPKSTLQSILVDGNTTLDTLIRIANALNVSLDDLVFGDSISDNQSVFSRILKNISWYVSLSPEHQEILAYHMKEIFKILKK